MKNIWILHFKTNKPDRKYNFGSLFNRHSWPMNNGWGLGSTGAYNFFIRYGFTPHFLVDKFPDNIDSNDILIICLDGLIKDEFFKKSIRQASNNNISIVCSGSAIAWINIFPEFLTGKEINFSNVYSGIGFHGILGSVSLIAPPKWSFYEHLDTKNDSIGLFGTIVSISGERQSPIRAIISQNYKSPAILKWNNTIYLNASPFHAFQSWLQGQEKLSTWWEWRRRIFWLDDYCIDLMSILNDFLDSPFIDIKSIDLKICNYNTVIIKHDLDYSTDISYYKYENESNIPATYAILDDRNFSYWKNLLKDDDLHESSFHYNTSKYFRYLNFIFRKFGIYKYSNLRFYKKAISNNGLINQIKKIKYNGLTINTIHRHLQYIYYPEYIESFRNTLLLFPEILGGCSFFRGVLLRWGITNADSELGDCGEFPDSQFPYWYPFKLAHAGLYGEMIDGWECTSLIEADFKFVEKLLNTTDDGLPGRVFVLNYHPAHTKKAVFNESTGLDNFISVINYLVDNKIQVSTLNNYYFHLNKKLGRYK